MYLTEIKPDEIKAQIKNINSKKASDSLVYQEIF